MKQVIKSAMPFMAIFVMTACGSGNEKKVETSENSNGGAHDSIVMNNNSSSSAINLKDDKLNAVYQHYIHLTNALVNADVSEAKIAANAIEAGAKEVNGGEKITTSAAKITAAAGIEAQRNEYSKLSNELIALAKRSGLNSGELYVDFCPMAMNDKGAYWLSSNKEIKNPYFGDKMLTCGEVKETLKQ
jgi:hypothetical protein